uniref:VWFA domain-containing protein n=1 Tax=Arcella intermedia TaxID=1963864 RepID=A0A6B2KZD7_9EUKA
MKKDAVFQDPENEKQTRSEGINILDLVKHSVKTIMHTLSDQDRLAVVAFDSDAITVFPPTVMTAKGRTDATAAIEKLQPRGNTNIWAGLLAGLEALRVSPDRPTPSLVPRKSTIILLTDGRPNRSPPEGEPKALKTYFEKYPLFKCQVNTFGFGYSLNSQLLHDLCYAGNGTFSFIPDAKIVGTCFVNAVANICSTMSQHAKVHLVLKGGSSFCGPIEGNLPIHETTWGRVVDIGPLQFGQNRDISVPLAISNSSEPYLEITLEYDQSTTGTHKLTYLASNRQPTANGISAVFRNKVVSTVSTIITKCDTGKSGQGVRIMKEMVEKLGSSDFASPHSENSDPRLVALYDDLSGRVSKAISTEERWKRWGKHYLLALNRSHQLQMRTNFMDPGLQVYGGSLFVKLMDEGGKVFITLPMKKTIHYQEQATSPAPANNTTKKQTPNQKKGNNAPAQKNTPKPTPPPPQPSNETYYAGCGGGCFDSSCVVEVQRRNPQSGSLEGKEMSLSLLNKGDRVTVIQQNGEKGTAKIECVVKIELSSTAQKCLYQLPSGLILTKNHPIRVNGKWSLPKEHPDAVMVESTTPYVYNVVLDHSHVMIVNETECCTLAHGIKDPIAFHPFYATQRVIERLSHLPGWDEGHVTTFGTLRQQPS